MPDEFTNEPNLHEPSGKAALSDDAFLGGKLQLLQPEKGYRAGIDAVLLAASVPAAASETVFEAGIGTGVAAACLARRVDGLKITGVEISARYAMIAQENATRNGLGDAIRVLKGDLTASLRHDDPDWPSPASFDHAYANPPFFEETSVQAPADQLRAQAHLLKPGALDVWVKVMAGLVRPRGTVSVIHPASSLPRLLAAMEPKLGNLTVMPMRARRGEPASRIIVRGTRGSKAPLRLLPGLVLHGGEGGGFLPEIDAVLRTGAPLAFE